MILLKDYVIVPIDYTSTQYVFLCFTHDITADDLKKATQSDNHLFWECEVRGKRQNFILCFKPHYSRGEYVGCYIGMSKEEQIGIVSLWKLLIKMFGKFLVLYKTNDNL